MNGHPLPPPTSYRLACRTLRPGGFTARLVFMGALATALVLPAFSMPSAPAQPAAPVSVPETSQTALFTCIGEPLQRCLPRLGETYGIPLTVAPELEAQRVSIFARSTRLDILARALTELLSDSPEAPVRWRRSEAGGWQLEQPQRRPTPERLFAQSRLALTQLLQDAAPQSASGQEARRDPYTLRQEALAAVTRALTPEMQEQLHAEEPVVVRISDLPEPASRALQTWIRHPNSEFRAETRPGAENGYVVYLRAPHHEDPLRGGLSLALISERGQVLFRTNFPDRPWQRDYPRLSEGPGPKGRERPVHVMLTGRPHPDTGRANTRLDEMLEAISRAADVTIISDGYVRPALPFPHFLTIEGWALDRLMDAVTGPWRCDWRFLDADKRVILVRARHPWLEDAAELPDEMANSFRSTLGPEQHPRLTDLVALSRLNQYQVRRLSALGYLEAAGQLWENDNLDGTGVLDCLRFYAQLPRALRTQAESPEGLPLALAPQTALRELQPTLLSRVGAITPAQQQALVFRLGPDGEIRPGQILSDYLIELRGPDAEVHSWKHRLRGIALPLADAGSPL